jgi:UDP:flavonoid glycosyltransferase YjiC (YdhE family)
VRAAVVAGPDAGHAFPAIALAVALRQAGHDVLVATGARWRADITAEGCAWLGIPDLAPDPRDSDFGFRIWGRGREMAPALADALRPHAPDVVVADTLTVAGWFAADLLGAPRVELVPHLLQLPSRALPPPGLAVRPARTPLGRARDALLRRTAARSLALAARQRDEARAGIGLPPGGDPALRLVATLPALERPRPDWPERTHVVGPLMWEPTGPAPALAAGDGPVVLVTDSTATGGRVGLVDLARSALPAAGFRVAGGGFAPQLPVLAHADAVVFPGGHGLLGKALAHGVPVVVVPGPGDQAANAQRVRELGCGVVVRPDRLDPRRLRAAVEQVTGDPRYRAAARSVAASGAGLGPARAVELVAQLLGSAG